jgi:hypothetical protein
MVREMGFAVVEHPKPVARTYEGGSDNAHCTTSEVHPHQEPLLSSEMAATAEALRDIRRRLHHLIAVGNLPESSFASASVVLVEGIAVAIALEELAR